MSMVTVRYNGFVYKVAKAPFETDEKAHDRAWYIVKTLHPENRSWDECVCLSHIWANNKYHGIISDEKHFATALGA
jgi:hypothetical protein